MTALDYNTICSLVPSIQSMQVLLDDSKISAMFHDSLRAQHSPENSDFYLLYIELSKCCNELSSAEIDNQVRWIIKEYVVHGSERQLNLTQPLMQRLTKLECSNSEIQFSELLGVKDEVVRIFYQNNYLTFVNKLRRESEATFTQPDARKKTKARLSFIHRILVILRLK